VENKKERDKKLMWSALFVIIAALSIWAVVSQSNSFSINSFMAFVMNAEKLPLIAAALSMVGFITFEGMAIVSICKSFGYKCKKGNGFVYSAADIYFSAITPSATGGQPASAFFMVKDGIPLMFVTVALIANLMLYTIACVAVGLICFALVPSVFFEMSFLSKLLIVIGFGVQSVLALAFMLLLSKPIVLHKILNGTVRFLCRLRILREKDAKLEKVKRRIEEYEHYTELLKTRKTAILKAFLLNLIHKLCQGFVTMFTCLAAGAKAIGLFKVFSLQMFVMMGAYCVPVPGAMGVTDYILLDGFNSMNVGAEQATNLELLSRSLSFYICVLVCGITVVIKYLSYRKK